jgi:hypothetical protein
MRALAMLAVVVLSLLPTSVSAEETKPARTSTPLVATCERVRLSGVDYAYATTKFVGFTFGQLATVRAYLVSREIGNARTRLPQVLLEPNGYVSVRCGGYGLAGHSVEFVVRR